jgi:hypothetical protein
MHSVLHAFHAQTAPPDPAQSPIGAFGQFLPFILIAAVFYFVFFRPQQRQAKQQSKRDPNQKQCPQKKKPLKQSPRCRSG